MGKIKFGISACLLGQNVRYDGGNSVNLFLRETLADRVAWVAVCPECEFGFPVPREKITLRPGTHGTPALWTMDTRREITAEMRDFCRARLEILRRAGLRGFVFKGKSPSCGLNSAPVRDFSNAPVGSADGVFAAVWKEFFPELLTVEAESLENPAVRRDFLNKIKELQKQL